MHPPNPPDEDKDFVIRIQSGEREAFHRLVNKYDQRLHYFVSRIVDSQDEALDVMQTAWMRVYRSIHKLREPKALRVWLYRIAHDESVNSLRKKSRHVLVSRDAEIDPFDESVESPESLLENVEIVHGILKKLSWEHRQVLTLTFMEGMSVMEISDVINTKPGTVKSRLYYAREAFKKHFKESTND